MCGIAGQIDFSGGVDRDSVVAMCAALEHRGPDSFGVHRDDVACIGARRLAIVDIARGDQPISNEDGTVVAALNGEIYNFEELRDRLVAGGHRFASNCDTEVLVHLYEEHGEGMVELLRGMFAFAVWDATRRRLFCARDRVGKKPLFWARRGERVWFASELGALIRDPRIARVADPRAIDAYLALQYVPHPLAAITGVQKLPPASTLTVSRDSDRVERYWALDYSRKLAGVSSAEAAERLRAHIADATRMRLMGEVPLGAFLSGGIDSSVVVACMAAASPGPVKTFSIGFADPEFDETSYARQVAEHFGTDHHELRVEPEALSVMPRLARHYGEPYADPSAIPSFYLAEMTRKHVTVALNGDGGDESFAGYPRYMLQRHLAALGGPHPRLARGGRAIEGLLGGGGRRNDTRSRLGRVARTIGLSPADRYAAWMGPFDAELRGRLLTPEFAAEVGPWRSEDVIARRWRDATATNALDRLLEVEVQTFLPGDLLVKVDIASMAYSLEARSPLLDHVVMEFAASLPPELKLRRRDSKHILKEAFRAVLPDAVVDRPKQGFEVPLRRWFRHELRGLPEDVLLDDRTRSRGYFHTAEVERLITEHQSERADHSHRLWALLQLEMWHREVLESPVC